MRQLYEIAASQTMNQPVIRRAGPKDAQALSDIGKLTFSETFAHLYPPHDLKSFLQTSYGIEKTRDDLANPAKAAWLVEADGQVIGHALAGPCKLPHPDVTAACGELDRLYVLAAHQGGGLGSRLLQTTLDWLEQDGPRRLWIGVWSQNHGAQNLYARHGFEKVGEYEFEVGQTRDHEFIMRRG